jgi:NADH-quinone oxidoreductase subunit B
MSDELPAATLSSEDLFGDEEQGNVEKLVNAVAGDFINWAQRNSPWPLHFGIMCCALEMAAAAAPRYDSERLSIVYRSSPRQCDIMLVTGPITKKLEPKLLTLWEQMPEPKWTIAMGECAISGGPFWQSYNVLAGVDTFIPVDIYIPGCPPRPEALLDGFEKLKEKIKAEKEDLFRLK